MAIDGFGRRIDYLRVSVTDRCNMGCVYCMPAAPPARFAEADIYTPAELGRIASVALGFGVRKIRLTGGEPLVRPDIIDIVSCLKRLGVRDLSLTTNGSRLRAMAGPLAAAGLDRVNVSLDSLEPGRFSSVTGGGELGRVLEGIASAKDAGLTPVKINMVPMRGVNDGEIPEFAALSLAEPVHVRFIEFMPTAGRGWSEERCVRVPEIMGRVEAAHGPLERLPFRGGGTSRNYRIKGASGVVGFISPVSHGFCSSCSRLRISAAGRIRPCLFSSTEIDVLGPLRRGADDAELARLFGLAIIAKPEGNYLSNGPERASHVSMSSIGG